MVSATAAGCLRVAFSHVVTEVALISRDTFLPRDAMRKRGLCCRPVSVRLSVRLTRWCIVSTRLKISSNFFNGLVALVFYPLRRYPIPRGTHSAGAKNTRGWEHFAIFDRNRRLSRKWYEVRDRSMVAMER